MSLKLPVTDVSEWVWIRKAAGAINSLLNRTAALESKVAAIEAPPVGTVRWEAGNLEYWDGSAWLPV